MNHLNINLVGVASYAGALYSGTESAPVVFREVGLLETLKEHGANVTDLGDITLPTFLPRHNIAPIRNYPGPKMVWDSISHSSQWFSEDKFTFIIGGDCSIVVGTADLFYQQFGDDSYLLVVDAHIDNIAPNSERCIGAAAMGLWFLQNENPFHETSQHWKNGNISVVGCQQISNAPLTIHTLDSLRTKGITEGVKQVMNEIPKNAKILVHFDIDVIVGTDMPVAYAPTEDGLTFEQCEELLNVVLQDQRVKGLELTEFSGLKDTDHTYAKKLSNMISRILREPQRKAIT